MNEEIKIWTINMAALIISFQDIDDVLRLSLLVLSVVYTGIKIHQLLKKDKND